MALAGFNDEQVQDAARTVSVGAGYSAYFNGIQYPLEKFKQELDATVKHIRGQG